MKIFVVGTRGIPDIPGGVETHCENLYPILASQGHDVIVSRRSKYVHDKLTTWKKVRLITIYSPKIKSLEAIVHTFLSVIYARVVNPDIVHFHSIGPGLFIPLARIMGLNVVLTNHGPDYNRAKWGPLAKRVLLLGEYLGTRYANQVIVISEVIKKIVYQRCHRDSTLIVNGVNIKDKSEQYHYLEKYNINKNHYIVTVSRFVPEKGLHDLLKAYSNIETRMKLVLVGDADHESEYSLALKKTANDSENVVMTGYLVGDELDSILSNARLCVFPSYHEGFPIALLEALSYGLQVLVSDIPAHQILALAKYCFFTCGDTEDLTDKLRQAIAHQWSQKDSSKAIQLVSEHYDWSQIAHDTLEVFKQVQSS